MKKSSRSGEELGSFSRVLLQHAHLEDRRRKQRTLGKFSRAARAICWTGVASGIEAPPFPRAPNGLVMLGTFGACSAIFLRVSVAHETATPQLGQPHPKQPMWSRNTWSESPSILNSYSTCAGLIGSPQPSQELPRP
jgi:hypothetical protein